MRKYKLSDIIIYLIVIMNCYPSLRITFGTINFIIC